jgi:preprotein translocase subunit SecY
MNLVLTSAILQWSWSYIHSGDAGRFDEKHRREVPDTTRRNWLILVGATVLAIIGILIPVFYVQFALVAVPLGYSGIRLVQGQHTSIPNEVAVLAVLAIIGILIGIFFGATSGAVLQRDPLLL